MTAAVFAIPGDIDLRTGGYTYDRRVLALLPRYGVAAQHLPLPGGYPAPTPEDLAATARVLAQVPKEAVLLIDGLAYGAMPPDVIAAARGPIVALVHHPLCLETGLSPERQAELRASETAALALARHVIVTSATTAGTLLTEFGVPADRITVAEPGTDAASRVKVINRPRRAVPRRVYRAVAPEGPAQSRETSGASAPCGCWRWGRSCRARATTCWCRLSTGSGAWIGSSSSPATASAARRPRRPSCIRSGVRGSGTGSGSQAPLTSAPSRQSMLARICSSCRPSTRATAWCSARPWSAVCRSLRLPAAPPRRRLRTARP